MSRPLPTLVIDARPRGPHGPLAVERVLGRPVLAHLVELAASLDRGPLPIHARQDEHGRLRALLEGESASTSVFVTGAPPEGSIVLRADRLYDPTRLRRAIRRGKDPESAVVWRLDAPHGLAGASDELTRRRTYQPIGHRWALAPARLLARALCPTPVRPNALTLASAAMMLGASAAVAWAGAGPASRAGAAIAMALALVLDTADGHLARLQGTASEFGRWLDALLDELGDMTLHAAVAWAAYCRDHHVGWLMLGMAYGMGKYVFVVGTTGGATGPEEPSALALPDDRRGTRLLVGWARLAGHADVRWHLWIVLAALGRLDVALAAYAAYFPARALAGAIRKAAHHA